MFFFRVGVKMINARVTKFDKHDNLEAFWYGYDLGSNAEKVKITQARKLAGVFI